METRIMVPIWQTYLQGMNRDTDVENGLVDTEGKEKGWWDELGYWDCIHILPRVKETESGNLL